ncbi:solute carrier family 22 member 21 [Patella vulgata]|uniref:solute carrier family 22 member 21 n=1 Tax=Patella vulgata TaxID=6465 RepID=UPI0024A8BD45|nr:solute carrier family 22 member 21 [Patella vulgata]
MVFVPKLAMGYNMMIMAFGALEPEWWCADSALEQLSSNSSSYKQCDVDINNSSTCHRVYDGQLKTVVSEWDLVCERKWVTPIITSIQMSGVLVGTLICGQLADSFGRKKTFYLTLLLHSIVSIGIGFSTSWQMFTALRFVIGIAMGAYLVVCMFPVEFLSFRWRPFLTLIPFWATGVCFLSLSTYLLQDWSYVHIAVGIFTVPCLLGWFIIPESVRWLAVKGQIKEAEDIVEMVAKMNGRVKPSNTKELIMKITKEEEAQKKGGKTYSYLDIYRGAKIAKHTISLHIVWWCLAASYYGFSFGVGKFSGNYYLNQFLMNILEFPICIPAIYFMNRFGRRAIGLLMLGLGTSCCVMVVIVQYTVNAVDSGTIITVLSLATRIFTGQAWAGIITMTNESYPTVIRSLGYGAANTSARLGSVVAPFVFALTSEETIPYVIVIVLEGVSFGIVYFLLPETLGTALEDLLPGQQESKEIQGDPDPEDEKKSALNRVEV